jgi:hypothetical protein
MTYESVFFVMRVHCPTLYPNRVVLECGFVSFRGDETYEKSQKN